MQDGGDWKKKVENEKKKKFKKFNLRFSPMNGVKLESLPPPFR